MGQLATEDAGSVRCNMPCYTILIVDNSEVDRSTYRRFLLQQTFPERVYQFHSCQILEAATGEEALAYCRQRLPNVILLDYLLPDMSGLEAVQKLRQQWGQEKMPIIMMAGQSSTEIAVAVLKAGALDYLDKAHIRAEDLQRAVMAVIQQMQLIQTLQQQQQRQQLLTHTALQIRQSFTLEDILQTAVDEVRQILDCDRVLIYQFQSDWQGCVTAEAVITPEFSILNQVVVDECFSKEWAELYGQGRTKAIEDIYTANLHECHVEFLERFQVRANLVVPILQTDQLWGLLIAHQCTRSRRWQDTETDFLQALVVHLSIAIQQSVMVKQLGQSQARFQAMYDQSPLGIMRFNPDGSLIAVNASWEEMWSSTAQQIQGYNLLADPQVEQHSHLPTVQRAFAGETIALPTVLYTNRTGRSRWIEPFLYPIKDADGQILEVISITKDVTDRTQAELKLEKFRFLVDHASDMVVLFSEDCRFQYANQAFCKAVEFTHQELLSMQACEIYVHGSPDVFQEMWQAAQQAPITREIQHRTKSGYTFDAEVSITYFMFADQAYLCVFARDVTNRKQVERQLHQAKHAAETAFNQLNTIINNTPDLIAALDTDYCYTAFNRAYQQEFTAIFGRSIMVGDSVIEALAHLPEDQEKATQLWRRALLGETFTTIEEFGDQSLARKAFEFVFAPIWNTVSTPIGATHIVRDVTDRLRAEDQLRQSEEKFRQLAENINDVFWMSNAETSELLYINPAYEMVWGRSCKDLYANPISFIEGIHPDDQDRVFANLQARDLQPFEIEYRILRPDQTVRWVIDKSVPIKNDAGEIYRRCGIVQDITNIKQAEVALQQLNQDLEHRVQERTDALKASNTHLQSELLERKQAERALQTSEARFRSAFEDAAAGMTIVSPEGIYLRGNSAFHRFLGYSEAELIGVNVQSLTYPDDLAMDLGYMQQLLVGEIPTYQLEKRYFHKAGHLVWGLLSASLVRDEQGTPLYFIRQIQDIHHRKRAEVALHRELLRSKAFVRTSFDGIVILDQRGYVVEANQSFAQMLGYSLEEVLMLHISDWDAQWTRTELMAMVQNSTLIDSTFETIHRRKDGSLYHVEISEAEVQLEDDKIQICICRDISARKQAEAILRESDRRWRSLLDNVQLVVVGLTQDGTVEYVNPFFLALTKFSLEEVVGKNWIEHFIPAHQRPSLQSCFAEVIEHNFHPHYQNSILTQSGEERMIAWSNTLLRNPEGVVIGTMSIGEDITERYQLERMKAEFVSVVSHELRTPLTSMQAALSLLVDNIIDPATEEGQEVIEIASTGVDRLVRLVNDILDLERLESGKIRLEKRLCNTVDLINSAVGQMQEMANRAGVILNAFPQSFQIDADRDRILQVLTNLLSNAIKFSSSGSTVTLSIEMRDIAPDSPPLRYPMLLFTLRDQGRGIPADKLDSIFERFQQVDASDSREKGGTGLGLAICRSIVQQHGGQIWVESIVGQGSTFYFTLPQEDEHDGD
jgi:PAS domain S-box-containing protein